MTLPNTKPFIGAAKGLNKNQSALNINAQALESHHHTNNEQPSPNKF